MQPRINTHDDYILQAAVYEAMRAACAEFRQIVERRSAAVAVALDLLVQQHEWELNERREHLRRWEERNK